MSQIRRKTAYAGFAAYLRRARSAGLSLSWDRYEQSLPQDGFARLGLFCADCLMGPCRLNPFAETVERTVCGFDRDDLVYRTFMRLLRAIPVEGDRLAAIQEAARRRVAGDGADGQGMARVGLGVLTADKVNICVQNPAPGLLSSLCAADVQLSLVGRVVPGYDTAASFADAEFALMTGLVDAIVIDGQDITLLRGLAAACHTAIVNSETAAADILAAARAARQKRRQIFPDASLFRLKIASLRETVNSAAGPLAVIGGGGNIKQTVDELALGLAQRLGGLGVTCLFTASAAAALAKYGLNGRQVIYSAASAADLLNVAAAGHKKIGVFLPEIGGGDMLAEAIALGSAGFAVFTATELPLGNGLLGDRLASLLTYRPPSRYLDEAAAFFGG
jgi:hypothetical protein